jgi:hypothetical protein
MTVTLTPRLLDLLPVCGVLVALPPASLTEEVLIVHTPRLVAHGVSSPARFFQPSITDDASAFVSSVVDFTP